jgi:hypothetical protein
MVFVGLQHMVLVALLPGGLAPPPPGGTARWVRTAAVRQHLDLTSFRTAVRHLRLPSSMCLAG